MAPWGMCRGGVESGHWRCRSLGNRGALELPWRGECYAGLWGVREERWAPRIAAGSQLIHWSPSGQKGREGMKPSEQRLLQAQAQTGYVLTNSRRYRVLIPSTPLHIEPSLCLTSRAFALSGRLQEGSSLRAGCCFHTKP